MSDDTAARELEYHERLYSGEAQRIFYASGTRALRAHMVRRILKRAGASPSSRVLSLGCGIGDTELVLAPHVAEVVGIDFSPRAIAQAEADAKAAGVGNARFLVGDFESVSRELGRFDVIIGIFFLHHLQDQVLARAPETLLGLLEPRGRFYGIDTSARRLTGAVGHLLIPRMMAKYHSPGEHELEPRETTERFQRAGFSAEFRFYDFLATPLMGLFPSWSRGFRWSRRVDEVLIRTPVLRAFSSNFELLATAP